MEYFDVSVISYGLLVAVLVAYSIEPDMTRTDSFAK